MQPAEIDGFFAEISERIRKGSIRSAQELHGIKVALSKKYGLSSIPGNAEILGLGNFNESELSLLRLKKTRTISGVAVVAAMTSPDTCPHGKCIYCPGGVDNNSPQAYTGYEPAALRGRDNQYVSYYEVFNRLKQLETIGHDTSKVDLIVMGGTFTARTRAYQESFVKGCFDAMNGFEADSIEQSMTFNETSERRCIGLTVETKPDWFFEKEIDLALSYGTTKVELGVQVLDENVLVRNNRGHGIAEIVRSTALSKDAGLKIVYHLMPGMLGSDEDTDRKSFDLMFSDPRFKPDMLKIYPTLVVKGTALYRLWKAGKYVPPDTEKMIDLLTYFMEHIPPWVRIQRIQRDIPVQFIEAGVKRSDIRNLVNETLQARGIRSGEIRSREIGRLESAGTLEMNAIDYESSGGLESFISYDTEDNYIAGFVRLRSPSPQAYREEVPGNALVRELKVFGEVVPIGEESSHWQHRGLGKKLMAEAEAVARDKFGASGILVTSGVGVREYFRKIGYSRMGPYMHKEL